MSEEAASDGSKKSPSVGAAAAGLAGAACTAVDASTNITHTQAAQMTASSAPSTENPKWSCEVCTYENFPLSRKCTMCRSPKPCLGEDIFKLQDGASALPSPDTCGAEAVAERLKPLRISSPQGQASASTVSKWPCSTCTYENWPRSLKCAMCGAAPAPAGINEICNSQNASQHDLESNSRRSKRRNNNPDWIWLQACLGVVEGEARRVEAYLAAGGDPARALTPPEVALLDRASAFDAGHTLVHLAIRFQRQDILSTLLSRISGGGPGLKRSPSYVAPDLATAIRRHIASCIRYKKGSFPCRYVNEICTFSLPAEIEELPAAIQEQLFSELLDRDAQQTLEADPPLINWSHELTTLGSRLYALWNRSAGDCLPDAVCQAAYGVFDRGNALRGALADALHHAHRRYCGGPLWTRAAGDCLPDAVCQAAYGVFDRGNALRGALADALHHAHRRYCGGPLWTRAAGDCLPDAVCQAAYGVFDRGNALRGALADALHHAHRRYCGGPLWTRAAGDCLPDAVCQAAYGVFDRGNALRGALADALHHAHRSFYSRWAAWERLQAARLHYAPEEAQLRAEWARLQAAAARPGTALHQIHVFVLAHVMRRPIIVYGVDIVNSFRGEALGYARFQGVYLPLLWEPAFCSPSPLALGYTRGHFSALVPLEPYAPRHAYICREPQEESEEMTFLPLTDSEGKLLPVHFLTCDEMSDEEGTVRRWVSAAVTRGGALAARQRVHARPLLQAQMLEEWLNHYRRLAQQTRGPFPPRLQPAAAEFSSGPDTDDE
ncbi:ubiquitin thioesterase trabid-like isoform X2 [Epargyreus clarus]|uniref:ubiquitin thioesterase trabid-like isoform X2 n=1 Tax=Epargyreus clarus TaxID=520877 RepID=UPI003C2F5D0D